MNQVEMAPYVNSLQDRRAALAALERYEKRDFLTMFGQAATGDVGDTDLGTDLAVQDVVLTLTQMEQIELAHIDAALDRARCGRYGICQVCGLKVSPERLAAVPEAACCVDCQDDLA